MTSSSPDATVKRAFKEAPAWKSVGSGWRQLSGDFRDFGYSVEWHDFIPQGDLDWSRSFHPGALEICLNLTGHAEVRMDRQVLEFGATTTGFYLQSGSRLKAFRRGGERHQFATVELSGPFLRPIFRPRQKAGTRSL